MLSALLTNNFYRWIISIVIGFTIGITTYFGFSNSSKNRLPPIFVVVPSGIAEIGAEYINSTAFKISLGKIYAGKDLTSNDDQLNLPTIRAKAIRPDLIEIRLQSPANAKTRQELILIASTYLQDPIKFKIGKEASSLIFYKGMSKYAITCMEKNLISDRVVSASVLSNIKNSSILIASKILSDSSDLAQDADYVEYLKMMQNKYFMNSTHDFYEYKKYSDLYNHSLCQAIYSIASYKYETLNNHVLSTYRLLPQNEINPPRDRTVYSDGLLTISLSLLLSWIIFRLQNFLRPKAEVEK